MITFLIGMTVSVPFWDTLRDQLLGKPSEEMKECHKPKPVLIHTGEVNRFCFRGEISMLFLKFINCQICM